MPVTPTGHSVEVAVGDAMIGRIINAVGDPIDDCGPLDPNLEKRNILNYRHVPPRLASPPEIWRPALKS